MKHLFKIIWMSPLCLIAKISHGYLEPPAQGVYGGPKMPMSQAEKEEPRARKVVVNIMVIVPPVYEKSIVQDMTSQKRLAFLMLDAASLGHVKPASSNSRVEIFSLARISPGCYLRKTVLNELRHVGVCTYTIAPGTLINPRFAIPAPDERCPKTPGRAFDTGQRIPMLCPRMSPNL